MDIVEKIDLILGEEGEGVADPGTTTTDIAKHVTKKDIITKKKKKKKKFS